MLILRKNTTALSDHAHVPPFSCVYQGCKITAVPIANHNLSCTFLVNNMVIVNDCIFHSRKMYNFLFVMQKQNVIIDQEHNLTP